MTDNDDAIELSWSERVLNLEKELARVKEFLADFGYP